MYCQAEAAIIRRNQLLKTLNILTASHTKSDKSLTSDKSICVLLIRSSMRVPGMVSIHAMCTHWFPHVFFNAPWITGQMAHRTASGSAEPLLAEQGKGQGTGDGELCSTITEDTN